MSANHLYFFFVYRSACLYTSDEVKWPILSAMSFKFSVSASLVCLALLLGAVESSSDTKFLLKKNTDGTYLLVPAPANASKETTVDIKSLPPIAVAESTPREAPGVNSQSPPAPAPLNPPAAPSPSGVKVSKDFLRSSFQLITS